MREGGGGGGWWREWRELGGDVVERVMFQVFSGVFLASLESSC